MSFYSTHLYELIRNKASFKMLKEAEQVVALCKIQYHLEEDSIGDALRIYEEWQRDYPDEIESVSSLFNLEHVCRIQGEEFNSMPWIYANLLQTLCADQSKQDEYETTAESELNYITTNSPYPWLWSLPYGVSYGDSFDYTYKNFMEKSWVQDFLEKIKISWPLTTAWHSKEAGEAGETVKTELEAVKTSLEAVKTRLEALLTRLEAVEMVLDTVKTGLETLQLGVEVEVQTDLAEGVVSGEIIWPNLTPTVKDIPLIPASPLLDYDHPQTTEAPPLLNLENNMSITPKDPRVTPKVHGAAKFWPYIRCKNVYKEHGGIGRISYNDLLIWLGKKWHLSVEELKKTNPYTLKGIRGLPTNYAYDYRNK